MLNSFVMHIQSLFFCVFIYIHVKGVLAARTAAAFIHEDDGMYGSVVFHQWSPWSPVVISLLFNNIKVSYTRFLVQIIARCLISGSN